MLVMIATLPLPFEQLDRLLAEDPAGREIVDAVEGDALRLRRVGVPGHDRNAGVDRAVDRVGQEVAVERRDRDAVDALRDERLEDLFLLQLVGAGRARSTGSSTLPSSFAFRSAPIFA